MTSVPKLIIGPRFEYKTVSGVSDQDLTGWSAEGWDVVNVNGYSHDTQNDTFRYKVLLKREFATSLETPKKPKKKPEKGPVNAVFAVMITALASEMTGANRVQVETSSNIGGTCITLNREYSYPAHLTNTTTSLNALRARLEEDVRRLIELNKDLDDVDVRSIEFVETKNG